MFSPSSFPSPLYLVFFFGFGLDGWNSRAHSLLSRWMGSRLSGLFVTETVGLWWGDGTGWVGNGMEQVGYDGMWYAVGGGGRWEEDIRERKGSVDRTKVFGRGGFSSLCFLPVSWCVSCMRRYSLCCLFFLFFFSLCYGNDFYHTSASTTAMHWK